MNFKQHWSIRCHGKYWLRKVKTPLKCAPVTGIAKGIVMTHLLVRHGDVTHLHD